MQQHSKHKKACIPKKRIQAFCLSRMQALFHHICPCTADTRTIQGDIVQQIVHVCGIDAAAFVDVRSLHLVSGEIAGSAHSGVCHVEHCREHVTAVDLAVAVNVAFYERHNRFCRSGDCGSRGSFRGSCGSCRRGSGRGRFPVEMDTHFQNLVQCRAEPNLVPVLLRAGIVHIGQTVTAGETLKCSADLCHAFGNDNFFQVGAVGKRVGADSLCAVGDFHPREAVTAEKGAFPNGGQVLGQGDFRQLFALAEYRLPQFRNFIGKPHPFQTCTAIKDAVAQCICRIRQQCLL